MEFHIDKHSSVPVIAQIEEQIRLAVAMGIFRNGDPLPSIREVEKQTGVNRGKVHRAYLSLSRSGLLVLAHGRGAVVAAPSLSVLPVNEKCLLLSRSTIQKARRYGIPPVVFARYLGRQAQEAERTEPFIAFVDDVKEIADTRAGQIAALWQAPVVGMTLLQLKAGLRKGSLPQKVLANHLRRDYIRSLIPGKKTDVIPVEIAYTEQTIKDLAGIKAHSNVVRILAPPYVKHSVFIIAQLQKWVRAPGVKISSISIRDLRNPSDIEKLVHGSQYDRVLMDPGILRALPEKLRRHPHLLVIRMQLSPTSLEAARIRSGVII